MCMRTLVWPFTGSSGIILVMPLSHVPHAPMSRMRANTSSSGLFTWSVAPTTWSRGRLLPMAYITETKRPRTRTMPPPMYA